MQRTYKLTHIADILNIWDGKYDMQACSNGSIEGFSLEWVLINSFHLPYHTSTECLTKCIPIGNLLFTFFLKFWCHCSFTPASLIQCPPRNPLIEHNEQSAFCNVTFCIVKKVLAMNPCNSRAWLTHGEHSITHCVKIFFLDFASTVYRIISLRSSSKRDVINVVHGW
jgi:uncharacterized DUF497 family protein